MKERPILFSGPMVKAILTGRKTQTRRVIKPQPFNDENSRLRWVNAGVGTRTPEEIARYCPYGRPGDRLWVREAWCLAEDFNRGTLDVRYESDGKRVSVGTVYRDRFWVDGAEAFCRRSTYLFKNRPSIHMPRWASRITLEVVSVRVERVQDISERDAFAEGVPCSSWSPEDWVDSEGFGATRDEREDRALEEFRDLWDSINAKRGFGWEANPWVWVVEFKVVAR